ncbi:hypothetical protein BDZ94DRAFT_1313192 [Collybia nuda]|uniref:Uncharacterized protein n=1 Tax=Collybia nuda TaxID=64659 RepID=A0A9P6CAM5_9AGAR|nr:hypothetical protein BDZ94DRAFT_1313192 [Collybia nuda]
MAYAKASANAEWSSPFAAWHSRALETPLPNPHEFTPTASSLLLAVLLNSQGENEGMTLALFSKPGPDGGVVAVDTLGRVLHVPTKDSSGILGLSKDVLALPDTGAFRNTWVIKHDRTSQPIDRIFIPSRLASEGDLKTLAHMKQVSVQGFSKVTRELKEGVEGSTELPDKLWELAGLVREAREDGWEPERRDGVVLGRVREVLSGLF